MITALALVGAVLCFAAGYFFSAFMIARDPEVVRMGSDEMIVKKPTDGLVLIAVTQQVARRIVLSTGADEKSILQARDLI